MPKHKFHRFRYRYRYRYRPRFSSSAPLRLCASPPHPEPENLAQRRRGAVAFTARPFRWIGQCSDPNFVEGFGCYPLPDGCPKQLL